MTTRQSLWIYASAIVLAGAFFALRVLSADFGEVTETPDHPVIALCAALGVAATTWFVLFLKLRRMKGGSGVALFVCLLIGVGLRLSLFGSTPVYENDYKRYLWDGAVVVSGEDPYRFSPTQITEAGEVGARSEPDLATLAVMSNKADHFTAQINSPDLTTIYPPAAQGVFAVAYLIAPFEPWALKLMFLLIEGLGLAALLAGLRARGQPLIWSAAYWLNPIVIFTTYNGLHMDILLVAPLLGAVLWASRRPWISALLLSVAAAIKIWPLLLAPVLFRGSRGRPIKYIGIAAFIGIATLLSLAPMLLSLHDQSGLAAYSANWTNSSFLFPGIRDGLGLFGDSPDRLARYLIAVILVGMSLWLGFISETDEDRLPAHLMWLAGAFVLLSPTGYPWYFVWFLIFLPLAMQHWSARGLALLTIGATAYYARFALGEAGQYDIYTRGLLPLEFGVPLAVIAWDFLKARRHG